MQSANWSSPAPSTRLRHPARPQQGNHTIASTPRPSREEGFTRPAAATLNVPRLTRGPGRDVRALGLEPRFAHGWEACPLVPSWKFAWPSAGPKPTPQHDDDPACSAPRTCWLSSSSARPTCHAWSPIRALALFTGLNAVPSGSYLASYSSRVDRRACVRRRGSVPSALGGRRGIPSTSISTPLPANTRAAGQAHYLSSRSRDQQTSLVFLARDASARVLCATPGRQGSRRPRRCSLRRLLAGAHRPSPAGNLIFGPQLTTYEQLHQLNQRGIISIDCARTRPMLGRI